MSFFKNFEVTERIAGAIPGRGVQPAEHGEPRQPEWVRGLSGHCGADHQYFPAGGDAPVAVRPAVGVLSGVRSHLLPSRRPHPAVACCARSTSCGEASPKLARSCVSVGWATAGALKRRWWHGIYAERGRIPTHARRPCRLDRLWRLGTPSRPRHRIGPNGRIEGDLFEYSARTRTEARQQYPQATIYADYREMLQKEDVELCDIVLPSDLHYEVSRAVLESGRHLLLEKPMTLSIAHCRELIELARARGRVLAVGHELRLSSLWGKVKELVDAGAIGEPLYALIELWRRPYRPGYGRLEIRHPPRGELDSRGADPLLRSRTVVSEQRRRSGVHLRPRERQAR